MGLNITLSISDEDQKILEDNLINPELWIKTMMSEKTANCYSTKVDSQIDGGQ